MNNEVSRLRRLRQSALKLRALAQALDGDKHGSTLARASVLSWRIARIATGRLRAHPYLSYQRDPGFLETTSDQLEAHAQALLATVRGRSLKLFLQELSGTSRELDDTRSLTLSAELSDDLGRAQQNLKALINEVRVQICRSSGQSQEDCGSKSPARLPGTSEAASPYLAL